MIRPRSLCTIFFVDGAIIHIFNLHIIDILEAYITNNCIFQHLIYSLKNA